MFQALGGRLDISWVEECQLEEDNELQLVKDVDVPITGEGLDVSASHLDNHLDSHWFSSP